MCIAGTASFPKADRAGQLVTLASGFAADQAAGALPIRQDARVLAATLAAGQSVRHRLDAGRNAYLAVAKGGVRVNGAALDERDGAAIRDESDIEISAEAEAEIVLVDTP